MKRVAYRESSDIVFISFHFLHQFFNDYFIIGVGGLNIHC